jgi:hypothetical protein
LAGFHGRAGIETPNSPKPFFARERRDTGMGCETNLAKMERYADMSFPSPFPRYMVDRIGYKFINSIYTIEHIGDLCTK